MMPVLQTVLVAAQLVSGSADPSAAAARPAPVEIVVFSDFQCPFCARFARPLRELQAAGADGVPVTVTFKNFPLPMHARAPLAHQAALAAGEQGRFWEMHDLLFANQQRADRDDLTLYARRLGLDVERFRADMDSDRIKHAIEADKMDGQQLRIGGTPTYYVNGREYSGATTLDELKRIVAAESARARAADDVGEAAMSIGSADARVTLELFADLQSPVTRPAMTALLDAVKRRPADVRLQFRHFPLSFHQHAPLVHEAAVVAARQGRFWEFAADLLDHPPVNAEADIVAAAGRVGLDGATLTRALHEHRYAARVDADLQTGRKKGIRGSPAIVINGRRIDGVPTTQALAEYIDSALSAPPQTDQRRKQ